MRRVDDEHAAGRQTRLPLGRAHVQRGVKPAAPRLIGQGLEATRQAVRFRPGDDGVPDKIHARGKALQALLDGGRRAGVGRT